MLKVSCCCLATKHRLGYSIRFECNGSIAFDPGALIQDETIMRLLVCTLNADFRTKALYYQTYGVGADRHTGFASVCEISVRGGKWCKGKMAGCLRCAGSRSPRV